MNERDFWNEAYQTDPNHTGVPDHILCDLLPDIQGADALDIGCGTGENALYLAHNGWNVTGVDWSDQAVFLAERAAFNAGVHARFEVADASKWNPRRQYDLVTILFSLPSGGKAATVIKNAVRLLRQGGTILVAEWDRSMAEPWGFRPCELHDPDAIKEMLSEIDVVESGVRHIEHMFAKNDPRAFHGQWARVAVVHGRRTD